MTFLSGYTKRKKITIDNTYVDSTLSDFPLLVKVVADTDIGANIDSNGYNIRFTSSDGTTLLKYERESFANPGSSTTGTFWVKVPSISGSVDTDIYIYYKSASPSDGADPTNVWDTDYQGVWHMEQDPSGSAPQILDSTSHAVNGTSAGSMTSGDLVTGKVDLGVDFDGSNDKISFGTASGLGPTTTGLTVSCLLKANASPAIFDFICGRTQPGAWANGWGMWFFSSSEARFFVEGYNLHSVAATGLTPTNWNAFDGTWDGSTVRFYVNGAEVGTPVSFAGPISYTLGDTTYFGGSGDDTYNVNAILDEMRVSSVARGADFLKFKYRNIFETDNEIAFSAEETAGGGNVTLTAAVGSYVYTGIAAPSIRTLPIGTGSFILSGQSISARVTKILGAGIGSYSLTGVAAGLLDNQLLSIGVGSYLLSGQSVNLLDNQKLTAGIGSYTFTGIDASLSTIVGVIADTGVYTLTGVAAGLRNNQVLTVSAGVFTLTGQVATLTAAQAVTRNYSRRSRIMGATNTRFRIAGATNTRSRIKGGV